MSLLLLEVLSIVTLLVAGALLIYVNNLTDKLTAKRAAKIERTLKLTKRAKQSAKKLSKRYIQYCKDNKVKNTLSKSSLTEDNLNAGMSAKDKHKILARAKKTTKR